MASKGCAVRGSGARLTPETLALCGSGYSPRLLPPAHSHSHSYIFPFLNTPLASPDLALDHHCLAIPHKMAESSYAQYPMDSRWQRDHTHSSLSIHSNTQPSSWWVTGLLIYPCTHSFIRPPNLEVTEWLTRTLTQHSCVIKGKTSTIGCSYTPSPAEESYSPQTRCTCFQRFFNAIGNRIYVRHARLLGADDILNISRAGYADADASRIRIQRVLALCKRQRKLPGDRNRIFTSLLTLSEVETLND